MIYNNDNWKLSNPDDDGHYTDDKPRISQAIFFKFKSKREKRMHYAMITTSGHDIKIWDFGGTRSIDVDEIETYMEDVQDEINRIKTNNEVFEYIGRDEFYKEFHEVHTNLLKLVTREAFY